MLNWRSIEEAPRDGRPLLLWARLKTNPSAPNDFYAIVGFWHHSIKEWKIWPEHMGGELLLPSHWLELPVPPTSP